MEIINRMVYKNDTFVCLGDVGDPGYIPMIRAKKKRNAITAAALEERRVVMVRVEQFSGAERLPMMLRASGRLNPAWM